MEEKAQVDNAWLQAYEANRNVQTQYALGRITSDQEVQKVEFCDYASKRLLAKESFFYWDGKWRNVNSESEFGAVTFNRTQIRPVILW
jgi:hypothetical protein